MVTHLAGMWVEAREQTFATRLEEQLRAALADKASLVGDLYVYRYIMGCCDGFVLL